MPNREDKDYDVIIIGAGAAGLMCSLQVGRRNLSAIVLDHSAKIGGKILISGGGRCNFTNKEVSAKNFLSANEHFCKSALTRYTSKDFISLVNEHGISFHEKKLGQLFCDHSARDILRMLEEECRSSEVEIKVSVEIRSVKKEDSKFSVDLGSLALHSKALVIATGGLSIPKLGASGFGYEIAKQFGIKVIPPLPALDGFVFDNNNKIAPALKELTGVSLECVLTSNDVSFRENILFTHKGLSGPAALQASLYWSKGDSLFVDLLPDIDIYNFFLLKKKEKNISLVKTLLSTFLPSRFAEVFVENYFGKENRTPLSQVSDKTLKLWSDLLKKWELHPTQTVGYSKAEVTKGGVDTHELSSKTMESKKVSGLYFIGEVVDVTGWLGGYNFQWAWSSAWAAAQAIEK